MSVLIVEITNIPSLQYHQRLFAIDNQVNYLTQRSLRSLGVWLARKWKQCADRKAEAVTSLSTSPFSIDAIEAQWNLQVQAQTTPLPRVSKTSARKAVEQVMSLVALHEALKKELTKLTARLSATSSSSTDDDTVDDLARSIVDLSARVNELAQSISQRKANLGIEGRASLKKMVNDKFLQLRVNAAALKERIRSKLRSRKFELERLDRAARSPGSNGTFSFARSTP
jgi:hypothetical protein